MIDTAIRFLKSVPQDIYLHFLVGLIVFQLLRHYLKATYCAFIVVLLALFKEYLDLDFILMTRDYLEPLKDIFFTTLGSFVGMLLYKGEEDVL